MGDIYDFKAFKQKRATEFDDPLFQKQIDRMDKMALLEEMIKYHEKRGEAKDPTSMFWIIRGIILFTALEQKCETNDVIALAGSYKRHLQHELQIKKGLKK